MSSRPRIFTLAALVGALLLGLPAWAASPHAYIPGEILIKYKPTLRAAQRTALRNELHARPLRDFAFIGVEHLRLEGMSVEEAVQRYRSDPRVEYVEPNYEIHIDTTPNDPMYSQLYGMNNTGQTGGTPDADIDAPEAWSVFTGDPNELVGVIDTGVDYNHPDLANNVWTNPGEIPGNGLDDDGNGYVDDVHGYDFYNNDSDPFDDNGHGTHVSGTIAAEGNNGIGVVGVNWHAKVVGIKFLSSGGSGSTAGAISGIQYAITVGVRLTSNSWGGGGFSQALLDAINAAGTAGQLFIAAAGNSGVNTDVSPNYPSAYDTPYIIAVAATDHNDDLASFSNWGPTTVDLAAPGVDILSCQPGNQYQLLSGTSMATPHVAGVAALAWGRFPAATNLQIKQLIMMHADAKPQLAGKCVTGGRLNALFTIADPDTIPPGWVGDLAAVNPGSNSMGLTWTAPPDDSTDGGRAARYDIRYSTAPIGEDNFASATPVVGPDPQPAGSAESFDVPGLGNSTTYYFALKALDEYGNTSRISNLAVNTTLGPPAIAAAPDSFSASLLTGGTDTQTLTISNTAGGSTLDWSIPTPELLFSQVIYPNHPKAKGEPEPPGSPVIAGSGGPDGFGYRWIDSDEAGGPPFAWVDITGVGTQLALTGDDASSTPVAMGMSFPFYGNTFTDLRVCTNGFLSFTDGNSPYSNQPLPNAGGVANMVAPFWDDLNFGSTPSAYVYNDGARFIVEWLNVPHYSSGGVYTFEAILYPTGEMRFQYLTLGTQTTSSTTGIQDAAKTVGLNVQANTAFLHDAMAIKLFPIRQWLTVSPSSGRINGAGSQDVSVHFDASGLTGGDYLGTIHINSNDPGNPSLARPARLHVTGAPDIAVNPTSIDYGAVFVGSTNDRTVTVSNPGTDNLVVSGITSDDVDVTASPASFTLPPLGAQNVTVRWVPTAPASLAATLTIASNDPDTPNKTVSAIGSASPAPSFTVEPESLAVTLLTNTATSRNLRVTNNGGSNYVFTTQTLLLGPTGTSVVHGDADNVIVGKGAPDTDFGPAPLRAGGPDVFGYTYKDSDEPAGPAFLWQDIRSVGTQLTLTGDDANAGKFPIGFSFPFYGATFDSFRVCTNGWVSFTSTLTAYSNTTLPNTGSGVPENLLAPWWDDLNFGTARLVWYHNDGTRLIIQYQAVPHFSSGGPYTFELILYPNGRILYQYLTMVAPLNSATIGIQNAARNDGLQVAYNAAYMHDALAIEFRPPARFLTVTPSGGTVPPGSFMDLTVGFNAASLFGGEYLGAVRLTGNDPILPQKDVSCRLTVIGVPDLTTAPASIPFGDVFIGSPRVRQLQMINIGSDVLHVSDITLDNAAYGVDNTSFNIPAGGSALVFVTFNPANPIAYPATLTIHSDDPDTPLYPVALSGNGLIPPDVDAQPASLAAALATTLGPTAASKTKTVLIHNLGGSPLNWSAAAAIGSAAPAARAKHAPAAEGAGHAAAGKGDPGTPGDPQVAGSGGPDAFGYRWVDSDEPGGPAFAWEEISAVGTAIPLSSDDENLGPFPLPFSFPFYSGSFNSFNICSNGWISFTSTLTSYSNTNLPNTSAPLDLIAPFWDDQDFRTGIGSAQAFYHWDGSKFIIEFLNVPHYSSGGPYTYEILLYPSGRIDYQYLTMNAPLNQATIGIQDAAGTVGLQVVYNAAYLHDNLRVRISRRPDWLSVAPLSGSTAAGGTDTLRVTFDANVSGVGDAYPDGDYTGNVAIGSNDPDEATVNIPCAMHVGVAPATFAMSPGTVSTVSNRTYIEGHVRPPLGMDEHAIVTSSVLVDRTVPVAEGQPPLYQGGEAIYDFGRLALLGVLPEGRYVEVEVIGEVSDISWFSARDTIHVLKPVMITLFAPPFQAGSTVPLGWQDPVGAPAEYYDLWYSADGGFTWALVAGHITTHAYDWTVPATLTQSGVLELAGYDAAGWLGSWCSEPFAVLERVAGVDNTLPDRFGLRFASPNPAAGAVRMELAVPARGGVEVRVHDVRGALVRRVTKGVFEPGRHAIRWDGRDAAGNPVQPGMYFVQAVSGSQKINLRLALVR